MKLFTKDIDNKLFKQYPLGNQLEKQNVVAKIFNPYGQGRWYLLNSDPEDPDYIWAIVQMGRNVEIGSVSRRELESIRISPYRFPLERDLGFRAVNAYELWKGLKDGKFYKEGGWVDNANKYMLENQSTEIEHHSEELEEILPKVKEVEPWVVAKAERAATDLSDLTHYLHGESRRPEMKEEVEEMSEEIDDFDLGGEMAYGGKMDVGRFYKDKEGNIFRFVGDGTFITKSGDYVKKAIEDFFDEGGELKEEFLEDMSELHGNIKSVTLKDDSVVTHEELAKANNVMAEGGETSSPNTKFMKWFVDWSKSVNKYVDVAISIPNEFSSPKKDDKGEIVILDVIEKKGDTDAKKYLNEILKKADEFGVSIYLQPIPRTHNLKSEEHKNKITKDYLIKYYQKFGFENTDGGFMVRAPKMAEGGIVYDIEWVDEEGDTLEASFESLEEAKEELKKIREEGGRVKQTWKYKDGQYVGTFAEGGEVKFKDKVKSVKEALLKRKKVAKKVQKDYGKTYSPKEAEESAKRIVGAMTAKERLQMRLAKKKKKK